MKVTGLEQELMDYDGVKHKLGGKPLTVKRAVLIALEASNQDPKEIAMEEKSLRHRLADRVFASKDGNIVLKTEDITRIKECLSDMFTPGVYGRCADVIDPPEDEEEEKNEQKNDK